MRAEVLLDLMAKVGECNADDSVKAEFLKMIESVGAMHGIGAIERHSRVDFARRLLDIKEPRSTIRDRLMVRFEIKESQAYRDIDKALQVVPKSG